MKSQRNYNSEVVLRLNHLPQPVSVVSIGQVTSGHNKFECFRITNFATPASHKLTILLSGGVHGDEPAGTYTLLDFLEREISAYQNLQFVIYPCVNPSGFELDTLENGLGHNLNRLFGTETPPNEIQLIQEDLKKLSLHFRMHMDMHEAPPYYVGEGYTEADNPPASWLYESQRNQELRIGRTLIDSLPQDIEVCQWERIYDDINDRGVIHFLPETTNNQIYAKCTSFDGYVFKRYSSHNFTTETPTGWNIGKRVRAQRHFLCKALNCLSLHPQGQFLDQTSLLQPVSNW